MDMKRILQAMDSVATKPVEGANDMARFIRAVSDKPAEIINEGANPHKVSLPVQMAMQHYQQPQEPKQLPVGRENIISKYFHKVEDELAEEKAQKRELINQYASTIAERVLMKENKNPCWDGYKRKPGTKKFAKGSCEKVEENEIAGHSMGFTGGVGPGPQMIEAPIDMTGDPNDPTVYGHQQANPMSLKGRIMSARAQLKELAQLAERDDLLAWEEICKKAKGGMFMGLEQNLEQIRHGISELAARRKKGGVNSRGIDKHIGENAQPKPQPVKQQKVKVIKPKSKTTPCRNGQVQTGVQTKDGKIVPKCSVR